MTLLEVEGNGLSLSMRSRKKTGRARSRVDKNFSVSFSFSLGWVGLGWFVWTLEWASPNTCQNYELKTRTRKRFD